MEVDSECLRISQECRGEPHYSTQVSTKLIGWLQHPNAAVSDIAGQCLLKLGTPAFDDLLAAVTGATAPPCPNLVWVLSEISPNSDRLLPLLRSWLSVASGELELQCAVSLACMIVARIREGSPPIPEDVLACNRTMERYLSENPAIRLRHCEFLAGLREWPPSNLVVRLAHRPPPGATGGESEA